MYVPTGYSNLHNTKHKHPLPGQKKGYFDVHLPEKAFPFYTYIHEVRIRVKSVASVSIIRFFAWQEGEFAKKKKKKEGMEGI